MGELLIKTVNEVLRLNPVTYSYNGKAGIEGKQRHVALIAQELQEVAPSLVSSFDYIEYLPKNNKLFDGALEILEYLKPNYKLHIITNGFAQVQDQKIHNANLKDYFATITNSDQVGAKKPNPIIFEYALDQAKAQKTTSIMIGDSFHADIKGALDIGLDP